MSIRSFFQHSMVCLRAETTKREIRRSIPGMTGPREEESANICLGFILILSPGTGTGAGAI